MLFLIIAITVLISVCIYIGLRLIVPAGLNKSRAIISWFILFFLCFLPISPFVARVFKIDLYGREIISWIAYIGLGFLSLVFIFLIVRDEIYLFRKIYKKFKNRKKSLFNSKKKNDMLLIDRRRFLHNSVNMGIMGISGLLTGYGIFEARRDPEIEKVSIPIKNLPANFNGFRIVQISDIHAGGTISRGYVQNIVNIVNSIKPDLVTITGDLVDGSVEGLRDDISPLAGLRSKYGTYFVTGNHEYYSGVSSWVGEIRRIGINVLLNEHEIIESGNQRLILAGVTDYNGKRFLKSHTSSPERAIAGAPSSEVKILLAHQPRSIYEASKAGFDLQLSGHTHGGQYYPYNIFVYLQQPFINGLHKYRDTLIYVNRGAGYWGPPMRIGIPSEITEITLI